jgi:hypothetical protein
LREGAAIGILGYKLVAVGAAATRIVDEDLTMEDDNTVVSGAVAAMEPMDAILTDTEEELELALAEDSDDDTDAIELALTEETDAELAETDEADASDAETEAIDCIAALAEDDTIPAELAAELVELETI